MFTVNKCPNTLHEVENASKRLGCGEDRFGKNQYMCLPNTEKTSLIEFCYDGIMGIKEKGICLEVNTKDGAISTISCTAFQSGCPENHYWNHQFFHYPACQDINIHHHCYVQHPSCPAKGYVSNDAVDINHQNMHSGGNLYYMLVIIPVIVIFFGVLWIFRKKRKKNRKRKYIRCQTDETPLTDVKSDPSICPDTASPDTDNSGLLQDSIRSLYCSSKEPSDLSPENTGLLKETKTNNLRSTDPQYKNGGHVKLRRKRWTSDPQTENLDQGISDQRRWHSDPQKENIDQVKS